MKGSFRGRFRARLFPPSGPAWQWLAPLFLLAAITAHSAPEGSMGGVTNHVLQLDGTNSYVELPADAFTNLDEVTVEGWVKWDSLGANCRFFDLRFAGYSLNVQSRFDTSTLHVESFRGDELRTKQVPNFIPVGHWLHVAVSAGSKGFNVFVNGLYMGSNAAPFQFSATGVEQRNYFGRSNFKQAYRDADLHGQLAEVRVWKG